MNLTPAWPVSVQAVARAFAAVCAPRGLVRKVQSGAAMNRTIVRCLCFAFLFTACDATEDDFVDEHQAELLAQGVQNPLDPPRAGQGVHVLSGSHLMRLPVSHFVKETVTVSGAHHLVVRTQCSSAYPERRDSGLYVVRRGSGGPLSPSVGDARYNDDCQGAAACFCATCSKVDMGARGGTATYDVYAFANQRTKAHCSVTYARDGAPGGAFPLTIAPVGELGGALVDVGPVKRGAGELEYFEVKTLTNEDGSSSADDTHMLLFDVGAATLAATGVYQSTNVPVYDDDVSATDRDPRIGPAISAELVGGPDTSCPSSPCPTPSAPKTFVLIGTEAPPPASPASARDVEVTVSLVRGPSNRPGNAAGIRSAPISVPAGEAAYTCGTPIDVEPGRYTARLRAKSLAAYGDVNVVQGDACELLGYDCPSGLYRRGSGNFLAFRMMVQTQRAGTSRWSSGRVRTVSNGVFGCGTTDGGCWHTIMEDFEVNDDGRARVCVSRRHEDVRLGSVWYALRNPRYSELKVATLNAHQGYGAWSPFNDGLESANEYRNISNLLATRGRFSPGARAVIELVDFAPFEWAADVIALQETYDSPRLENFTEQAETQSDLEWRYVYGNGKTEKTYTSFNSVITHELLRGDSLLPPDVALCDEGSTTNEHADGKTHCRSRDTDRMWTYIVPTRIGVRRWQAEGLDDVPIMVYSVILEPGDDNHEAWHRRIDLETMIDVIKQHLAAEPSMFNAEGSSSPFAAGNRIILAGDFNWYPHDYGENRWFVRKLRENFGYAIDTAAADRDSYANLYDMHQFRGNPFSPSDRDYPHGYTSRGEYNDLDDLSEAYWWGTGTIWPHRYPYWASTYHGETSTYRNAGERHDAIVLVGRGWSNDDPVRSYVHMHTTTEYDSPFAMKDDAGRVLAVDIAPWGDGDVPNSSGVRHYDPQFDIHGDRYSADTCTQSGCAAFESDHIPVAVRLRISQ